MKTEEENNKIINYIERNIEYWKPVYQKFSLKYEMGNISVYGLQTEDCFDIDEFYIDIQTGDKFASRRSIIEYVEKKVIE